MRKPQPNAAVFTPAAKTPSALPPDDIDGGFVDVIPIADAGHLGNALAQRHLATQNLCSLIARAADINWSRSPHQRADHGDGVMWAFRRLVAEAPDNSIATMDNLEWLLGRFRALPSTVRRRLMNGWDLPTEIETVSQIGDYIENRDVQPTVRIATGSRVSPAAEVYPYWVMEGGLNIQIPVGSHKAEVVRFLEDALDTVRGRWEWITAGGDGSDQFGNAKPEEARP